MPLPEDVAVLRQRVADLEAARSAQQHSAQALRAAKDAAEHIVETVREPLLSGADAATMAELARGRMRTKIPMLAQALRGVVREHHRRLLAIQ